MSGRAELTSSNNQALSERATAGRDLVSLISGKVVGQSAATYANFHVQRGQSRLASTRRRAGIFLLANSAEAGKSGTVKAVANLLNDSELLLKSNGGEFQPDRETAKLIGTPPGDLGHRETVPVLTQHGPENATGAHSNLALVRCDAIEKASAPLTRLLQGILDCATLRSSSNPKVNFPNSSIFRPGTTSYSPAFGHLRPCGSWFVGSEVW